jgi:hypothetical protein
MGVGVIYRQYRDHLIEIQCCGDVMAESRGGKEDRLLKRVYEGLGTAVGGWQPQSGGAFQPAITSKELKVKPKSANISGLQLADLLAHPCRHAILREFGRTADELGPFAGRLLAAIRDKFHRQIEGGQVKGNGKYLCPGK